MNHKWAWWEILWWAYSALFLLFWNIIFLFASLQPTHPRSSSPAPSGGMLAILIMSLPVLVFVVRVGREALNR